MKFRATGRDRSSGQPIEMVFEAADAQAAFASAHSRGIVVEAMNPMSAGPAVPPPNSQLPPQQYAPPPQAPAPKKNVRAWAVLLVLAALIGAVIQPTIGYLFFGLLILLMVLYVVPGMRGMSRATLGLSIGRPFATSMKMIFVGLLAVVMLLVAVGSQGAKVARQQAEAERVKAEAERQRLIAEDNAKVDSLMVAVKSQMDASDVAGASAKLADVFKVEHATNLGSAQRLNESIALSRNSAAVRTKLVELNDEEFNAFATDGKVPDTFNLGYPVLSNAVVALARPMVAEAKIERVALAKNRAEEVEQRRKDELARAEADRKQREQKASAEAAAAAAERAKSEKKIGETLHIGYTSYCVWRANWSSKLSDNEFLNKRANANWLIVEITVRNNDKKARTVPPFKLVDDQGREYETSTDGMFIENAFSVLEDLNPDVSKQGLVVFDVPKGRKYRMKLSGGYWSSDTGYIVLDPTEK
ncbi:MAG: DUF4352 domain-containing protein [Tepidisphaeraceae bacterium]